MKYDLAPHFRLLFQKMKQDESLTMKTAVVVISPGCYEGEASVNDTIKAFICVVRTCHHLELSPTSIVIVCLL